jgi:hypothetical protein
LSQLASQAAGAVFESLVEQDPAFAALREPLARLICQRFPGVQLDQLSEPLPRPPIFTSSTAKMRLIQLRRRNAQEWPELRPGGSSWLVQSKSRRRTRPVFYPRSTRAWKEPQLLHSSEADQQDCANNTR